MSNTANRQLAIQRLFKAPRELVFRMWTEPEHIKNWWGPNGFTNTISKMDVHPGGGWELIMHAPDGTDYKNRSVFVEVVWLERIVFDHVSGPKYRMTVSFSDKGNDTLVDILMVFDSAEQLEQVIKVFRADEGLQQNMEKLEAYLYRDDSIIKGADDFVIERTFNAPADKVWSAITNRDEMAQWYFDLQEFRPEIGFEFQFSGGPEDRSYLHLCKVVKVVPGRMLTYSWRYEGYDGLTFVTFELIPGGDKTTLRLTHSGLQTFPAGNKDFARGNFEMGWTAIIGDSLIKYLG